MQLIMHLIDKKETLVEDMTLGLNRSVKYASIIKKTN